MGTSCATCAWRISLKENGFDAVTAHPNFKGEYHRHGPTVLFSDLEMTLGPPATIGEHTETIMKELGYGDDEIRALEEWKVVVREGPWAPARGG